MTTWHHVVMAARLVDLRRLSVCRVGRLDATSTPLVSPSTSPDVAVMRATCCCCCCYCCCCVTARCELCRCFTVALFVFRRVPASTLYISVVNAGVSHQSASGPFFATERNSSRFSWRKFSEGTGSVSIGLYIAHWFYPFNLLRKKIVSKLRVQTVFILTYKAKSKKLKFLVMRVHICDTVRYASI